MEGDYTMWDKFNKQQIPSIGDVGDYIRNPLWEKFYTYIIDEYKVKPTFEYSRCSIPGWNIKFKKSGKNLCTVYPYEGYFTVLVVIGKNEKSRFEKEFSTFTPYLQDLYRTTKEGMGQRWLLIVFEDDYIFSDIKKCIAIRKG